MKPYDLWRKLHYLRNEDYKTNDEQLANVCAAIEADRKAAQTEAADTIEAQAAEIERLKVECQAQYHRGYYDGRTAHWERSND
jgi:hypothetical protein